MVKNVKASANIVNARLLKLQGHSAIIVYKQKHDYHSVIIDKDSLPVTTVGARFDIDISKVEVTPYGIDWSVVYPKGFVIDITDLQNVLYAVNVVDFYDLANNTPAVIAALNQFLVINSARLLRDARNVLEGGT